MYHLELLTRGAAVLVTCRASNDSADGVVVPNGIIQSLEDDKTDAFTSAIAICSGIECVALSVFAQEAQRCHGHDGARGQDETCPACNGLCVFSLGSW